MHWRTFERLQANHDIKVLQSLAGIAAKFKLLGERLEGTATLDPMTM